VRVEISVRKEDAPLVRQVAAALTDPARQALLAGQPTRCSRQSECRGCQQNAKAQEKPFAPSRACPVILRNKKAIREVISANRIAWFYAVEEIRGGRYVHFRLPFAAENNVRQPAFSRVHVLFQRCEGFWLNLAGLNAM